MVEYIVLAGLLFLIVASAIYQRVSLIGPFFCGVKEALQMSVRIAPTIAGYVFAFACFRAVGGFEWMYQLLHPVLKILHIPADILSILLARPFSGTLSLGLFADMLKSPHSQLLAAQAAVMLGSTETTLYVLAVYFSYVGIKRSRYALGLGLFVDLLGCLAAVWFCRLWF